MSGNDGKLYGFFRAKVVEVDVQIDELWKYGAVRVWVPDVMIDHFESLVPEPKGLIAFPANNPLGGRNHDSATTFGNSSVYIPRKGDWVWVFFEQGDFKKPYYWNAVNFMHCKLISENRKDLHGGYLAEPHKVTTIFRSHDGRCILVSDDADTQRVEINGKKRMGPPDSPQTFNLDDTFHLIDGNQTTIILDEREGLEKVLIRTHKGDFFHVDVDEQQLQAYFAKDIIIETGGSLHIDVAKDVHYKIGGDYFRSVTGDQHVRTNGKRKDFVLGKKEEFVIGKKKTMVIGDKHTFCISDHKRTTVGDSHDFVLGDRLKMVIGESHDMGIGKRCTTTIADNNDMTVSERKITTMSSRSDMTVSNYSCYSFSAMTHLCMSDMVNVSMAGISNLSLSDINTVSIGAINRLAISTISDMALATISLTSIAQIYLSSINNVCITGLAGISCTASGMFTSVAGSGNYLTGGGNFCAPWPILPGGASGPPAIPGMPATSGSPLSTTAAEQADIASMASGASMAKRASPTAPEGERET